MPTAVLARHGADTAASPVFYALTVAGLELALLWVFTHARRHGLTVAEVEADMALMLRRQLTVPPLVFLTSCTVALVWPPGALLLWGATGLAFFVSDAQMRRLLARHDAADAARAADGGREGVAAPAVLSAPGPDGADDRARTPPSAGPNAR